MSYESVDVYVVENTADRKPVPGVTVRVFDEENRVFFTQDATDDAGRVGFTLWAQRYKLRFFKTGVQVKQPLVIDVITPAYGEPQLQEFEAEAVVFKHPVAVDARLCRASGFFRDISGGPHPNLDMFFMGRFDPILLEGAAVLSERRSVRTDSEGFACLDLIRCARYRVTLEGLEDQEREVSVPDQPSVNLPDLLFPVVDRVTFDIVPTTLSVGQSLTVTPTVIGSNDVPLCGTAMADVSWSSSNDSVLSVAVTEKTLVLRGIGVGTAQLKVERLNKSIIRVPNTSVLGLPLNVSVS